jgi:quercetin dioxygenase-like cupin family protein
MSRTFRWEELEEETVAAGVRRKMIWGEQVMIASWRLAPLVELPVHEHVSEQATLVSRGSLTLVFPDGEDMLLEAGDMTIIPPSRPHGVKIGPQGCEAIDVFSPIREDFLQKTDTYLGSSGSSEEKRAAGTPDSPDEEAAYKALHDALKGIGAKITLEAVKEIPVRLLARYAYDKRCVSMGDLKRILCLDSTRAKALIREWKHQDDLSEISLQRKMERLVMFPGDDPKGLRSC